MRKNILVLLLSFAVLTIKAQEYNTGVGLRLGLGTGITVKHFIESDRAVEGILMTRWRGFSVTGLYEVHKDIPDVDRLHWYFGGGAHIGVWNSFNRYAYWYDGGRHSSTIAGIDGILGMEYNFEEFPINLSLDWKPAFNFAGYTGLWADELALSARFTF